MLEEGETQLNGGVGLSNWGFPVYVGFDYGLLENLSAGADLSFQTFIEKLNGYKYNHSIYGIEGNLNYHLVERFMIPEEFDFYVGAHVGYFYWDNSNSHRVINGLGTQGTRIGAQVGGRYYFNDYFGINVELAAGMAFYNSRIGITIKY